MALDVELVMDEELVVDEVVEDIAAAVRLYIDKRLPAPHISLELPAHVIEQSFALAFTLPTPMAFPQ